MNMKTMADLEREREAKQRELNELDRRINTRTAYGDDPFRNGDILKIMMTYPSGGGSYTYAAVKARGRYFLTGRVQGKRAFVGLEDYSDDSDVENGWTWEHFVAWLAIGDASVWRVSKLEKVL